MHRQHAAEHCTHAARDISYAMHARRTAVASAVCSAGILACPVTSARRYQLHQSFLRAGHDDVQRVVGEEVEVGRTSTSGLTCDAGTLGALSAGDLRGRYRALVHLLLSWCCGRVAAKPAEIHLYVTFLLGHVRVVCSKLDGSTTLRELRRTMHLRHAADGRGPRREVGKTSDLTLFVCDCQIVLS